jgi:Xaa-Pro aminopeptidase
MDIAGPEGYWVELRRRYRFQKFRDDEQRFWNMRHEAFDAALSSMKEGVHTTDLEKLINGVYQRHGYSNHGQVSFHAHGTGVNAVEAPTCPGTPRLLKSGMAVVLHPLLFLEQTESQAVSDLAPVDVVLITETGPMPIVEENHQLSVIDG